MRAAVAPHRRLDQDDDRQEKSVKWLQLGSWSELCLLRTHVKQHMAHLRSDRQQCPYMSFSRMGSVFGITLDEEDWLLRLVVLAHR